MEKGELGTVERGRGKREGKNETGTGKEGERWGVRTGKRVGRGNGDGEWEKGRGW